MGRITDTVKVLLIVNVIFYLGSQFLLSPQPAMELFALWFVEHPAFQLWQPLTHMFMHADVNRSPTNKAIDDDMVAVIRLGTDLNDNYYQIEKPLKISTSFSTALDVWPTANNLDVPLETLTSLKKVQCFTFLFHMPSHQHRLILEQYNHDCSIFHQQQQSINAYLH